MAVLKSTAYGQVRKSVGANNYYRRAGVQIVRSKPTFAPGRSFSEAQLLQQWRMKVAQFVCLQLSLGKCCNVFNVINNKLYNASSRYNRLVKVILANHWEDATDYTIEPSEYFYGYWDTVLSKFSIGDVKFTNVNTSVSVSGSNLIVSITNVSAVTNELLRLANKRRSSAGALGAENIGLSGFVAKLGGSSDNFETVLPVWNFGSTAELSFSIPNTVSYAASADFWLGFVLFVADGAAINLPAVDIKALHCTNSLLIRI